MKVNETKIIKKKNKKRNKSKSIIIIISIIILILITLGIIINKKYFNNSSIELSNVNLDINDKVDLSFTITNNKEDIINKDIKVNFYNDKELVNTYTYFIPILKHDSSFSGKVSLDFEYDKLTSFTVTYLDKVIYEKEIG